MNLFLFFRRHWHRYNHLSQTIIKLNTVEKRFVALQNCCLFIIYEFVEYDIFLFICICCCLVFSLSVGPLISTFSFFSSHIAASIGSTNQFIEIWFNR
jgi:hypothetical protein